MADPFFVLSRAAASVNTALDLALFINKVKTCPDDVRACFNLVKRVRDDVEYALSLRTKNRLVLEQRPYEAQRIDSIIESALESLKDIGILVERCRPAAYSGSVPLAERFKWVLKDSNSFVLRSRNLHAQHLAVSGEIAHLRNLAEQNAPNALATTTFENLDLLQRPGYGDATDGLRRPSSASSSSLSLSLHRVSSGETLVGSIRDDISFMQGSPERPRPFLQVPAQPSSPWGPPPRGNDFVRERPPLLGSDSVREKPLPQVPNPLGSSYTVDSWETAEARSIIEERTTWDRPRPVYEAPPGLIGGRQGEVYEMHGTISEAGSARINFSNPGTSRSDFSTLETARVNFSNPGTARSNFSNLETARVNFSDSGTSPADYSTPISDTADAYFRDLALQAEEQKRRREQRNSRRRG